MPSDRPSPLVQLTLTRVREFVREPEAMFWVFLFPLLLAAALGLAFRDKAPDRIPVGVSEVPGAAPITPIVAALGRSPVLLVKRMPPQAAWDALRTGKISLLVEPSAAAPGGTPGGAAGALPPPGAPTPAAPSAAAPGSVAGAARSVVFRFDETRPDARSARLEAEDALERAAGRRDLVAVHAEHVTEKGARYIDFLIPGLLGMNLMGTGIWSLAFGIVTARQKHLLKRLIATPMRRGQYLLAQVAGRLCFLVPEIVLLVGISWLAFGVAVRGSFLLLFGTCLLGAMSFCGLGLLVASRVRTVEGASGWANLVMLPMWLLSGVFFSSSRFPDRVQPLIKALPLTALNDALRGVMTEALPISGIAWQLVILALWGVGSYLAALWIFRWR